MKNKSDTQLHNKLSSTHKKLGYKIPVVNEIILAFEADLADCIHTNLTPEKMQTYILALKTWKEHPLRKIDPYNQCHKGDTAYMEIVNNAIKARNDMVSCHMRLIYLIVNPFQGYGLSLGDLITIAGQGAIYAAEHYDDTRGSFTSYMSSCIQGFMLNAIAKEYRNRGSHIQSLDAARGIYDNDVNPTAGREEGTSFTMDGHGLLANEEHAPDYEFFLEDRKKDIGRVLSTIPQKHCNVLSLYYGLPFHVLDQKQQEIYDYYKQTNPEGMNLDQIATILDYTQANIRYIREKGITRMKHRALKKLLIKYLGSDSKIYYENQNPGEDTQA